MRNGDARVLPEERHAATLRGLSWAGLVCMLCLTVLSMFQLGSLEFGPLRDRALQVDELYFSSCAIRSAATGELLTTGCHDSKGPLIYILHQLVQRNGTPYDLVAVKVAGFSTVALIAGLVALIAFRLAGWAAALVASSLIIQTLTAESGLLAFKTDTVGAVFMLAGLFLFAGMGSCRRHWVLFLTGLFFGLAVVTKQTYGFAAIAVILWLAVSTQGSLPERFASLIKQATIFGVGVLSPFLIFLVIFFMDGRHTDYLASFFLFPSIYGTDNDYSSLQVMAWKLGGFLSALSQTPVLSILFFAAAIHILGRTLRPSTDVHLTTNYRLLILLLALMMLGVLLISKVFFYYHAIPALVTMAILGGIVIGDFWPKLNNSAPDIAATVSAVLLMSALMSAASAWITNWGHGDKNEFHEEAIVFKNDPKEGDFAYVLGTRPDFYVYNGLIPASDVLFTWALPGAPDNWHFSSPDPASLRGRMLTYVQERALQKLFSDFSRTPPRYILVVDQMARSPSSDRVSDVPGFDEYLSEWCTHSRVMSDERMKITGSIYECRSDMIH